MNEQYESQKSPEEQSGWWEESLSRREAGKRMMVIGAGAALLSTAGITIGCGGDDDVDIDVAETAENSKAAIDVQKAEGWNVGADAQTLSFRNVSQTDSLGSIDGWRAYTDPEKLRTVWTGTNEKLSSSELINSLNQPTLQASIQPVHSSTMDEAYSRGLGMKALLEDSKEPNATAIVVDLPGPEAVAYAAALSDVAHIDLTLDNWPHPNGVVPSHETLGALLYYAEEVEKNKEKVEADAPTVLVMDSNRLVTYKDESNAFDNRYIATMPTTDQLKSEGITTIIYTTPDQQRTEELDDLNEPFVSYRESGINVTMMPLTDFQPASAETIAEYGEVKESNSSTTVHRTYYYGGHPYFMPFFYSYYPVTSMRSYNYGSLRSSSNLRKPTYTPSRRPTMFSSATTGGKSGVGKQKVSGFGRVSTRTVNGKTSYTSSSSTRAASSSRSGSRSSSSSRSGSMGRSGGRSSSG